MDRNTQELLKEAVKQLKAVRAEMADLKTHVMDLKKVQSNKKVGTNE